MSENNTNEAAVQEQDLGELLRIRRDKLKTLQEAGKDPFQITKFDVSHHAEEIKATQKTVYKVAFLLGGMLYLLHDTRKRQSALRDRVYALEKKAKEFDQALEYTEEDA